MDKRKIIVYVSGAYNGDDKGKSIDSNIKLAREAAIELLQRGFMVIVPHLNTYHFEEDCNITQDDYNTGYCELVIRCDAIFRLENWKSSKGALEEIKTAVSVQMPIFDSMSKLEEWFEDQNN